MQPQSPGVLIAGERPGWSMGDILSFPRVGTAGRGRGQAGELQQWLLANSHRVRGGPVGVYSVAISSVFPLHPLPMACLPWAFQQPSQGGWDISPSQTTGQPARWKVADSGLPSRAFSLQPQLSSPVMLGCLAELWGRLFLLLVSLSLHPNELR